MNKNNKLYKLYQNLRYYLILFKVNWGLGIGDWGLGIGDWGLGPIPNPQSPIPNPQSPIFIFLIRKYFKKLIYFNNTQIIY